MDTSAGLVGAEGGVLAAAGREGEAVGGFCTWLDSDMLCRHESRIPSHAGSARANAMLTIPAINRHLCHL